MPQTGAVAMHQAPSDSSPFEVALQVKHEGRDRMLVVRVSRLKPRDTITTALPLRVEITDPKDLSFLYSLQISQRDYPDLQRSLGLRVDFGDFPEHFRQLLLACDHAAAVVGEGTDAVAAALAAAASGAGAGADHETHGCDGPRVAGFGSEVGEYSAVIRHFTSDDRRARPGAAGGAADDGSEVFVVVRTVRFYSVSEFMLRVCPGNCEELNQYLQGRLEAVRRCRWPAAFPHACGCLG
jgi:hypothetical protein